MESSLEKIKKQLTSASGRHLLQGPLLKRSETVCISNPLYICQSNYNWYNYPSSIYRTSVCIVLLDLTGIVFYNRVPMLVLVVICHVLTLKHQSSFQKISCSLKDVQEKLWPFLSHMLWYFTQNLHFSAANFPKSWLYLFISSNSWENGMSGG